MGEQQLRVLLIESDLLQCRGLEESLNRADGYSVDTASDVAEAWEMVVKADTRYDIVLLNDTLAPTHGAHPSSVGLELKQRIETAFDDTEVAIYTGCGVERGCDSLRAPDLRCLGRSFTSDQLSFLVQQAAEKRRFTAALRKNEAAVRLLESSAGLLDRHSEDEVLESLLRNIQTIGFDRVRLYLLSEDGRDLVARAHVEMGEGFLAEKWPISDDEYMQTLIASPKPYVFQSEAGKPKHRETALAKEGVTEWASVPLLLRGKVIGSLSADNKFTRRKIREDDLIPIALFTSLATAAIEKARLLKETQHRAEQLELLRMTILEIGAHLNRRTLLETIIRQAVLLLHASSGSIFQHHPERGELTVAANYLRPEEAWIVLKNGEGMAGRLVVSDLPHMIVDDYDNWDGRAAAYEGKRLFEAVVQVPLKLDGRVTGVLSVDDQLPRQFTADDALLLSEFADHAAMMLGDSDLAEGDAKKARRLEMLSKVSSEIAGELRSLSLSQRLDLIAERATQVLGAEACGISWVKREGFLSWEASHGHVPGVFKKGREFAIVSEPKGGLSGHIAKEGHLFNGWGPPLRNHWAVKGEQADHTGSKNCYSLLALPLKNKVNQLVGLLRIENKLGWDGQPHSDLHFTAEDELILNGFGQAVVVAVEAAALVDELKEKKDHLERLVDSSPNGIISIDVQGRVTGFNDRAAEIMGYAAKEVMGSPVSRLYYPEREPRKIGKLLHLDPHNMLAGYETYVRGNRGEIIPIRLSATWLYDANNKRIGSVGYFEDLRPIRVTGRLQELLLNASNTLAHADDLPTGLDSLAKMMISLLGHTFCRILLFDEDERFLATKAVYPVALDGEPGWNPSLGLKIRLAEWKGLNDLLEAGTPLVLRYVDPLFRSSLRRLSETFNLSKPIEALMFVPLKIGNKVVGLIEMAEIGTGGNNTFSDEEVNIATAIASQTTMLIDRMRLFDEARSRGNKLIAHFEASNALVSDEDIQRTLQDNVERTKAAAEAGLVRVVLIDATGRASIQAFAGTQFQQFNLTDALRPENGISMQVMETREPRWIEDVTKEEPGVVNDEYLKAGIKAGVCFPLLRRGESMGVMWINYDHARTFSPEQRRDLQLCVNQAAIACANASRIDEMRRLHYSAEQMSRVSALADVLYTIAAQARDFFYADSSALSSFDPDLEEFIPDQFVGDGIPDPVLLQFREQDPTEHGITRTILAEKYLTVPNVQNEARDFMKDDMRKLLTDANIASFHGIALEDAGKCLGVLYVSFARSRESFTEEDKRQLYDFAKYAALAIRKARLLDQVNKTQKAAGIVSRVTVDRVTAEGIETMLSSVAAEIQKGLGANAITLYACGETDGRLRDLPGVAGLLHPEEAFRRESVTSGSMLHTILHSDSPRIAENVLEDPVFRSSRFAEREKVLSCCAYVLKAGGERVGVMFVNYRARHRFTADELGNIEMFANQAGAAIANTRLFDDLRLQLREQGALLRMSEALLRSESVQEILDHAAVVARRELGTDYCSIILPDKQGNLILSASAGWPDYLDKARLGFGDQSQAGFTIESEIPVICEDYSKESRFGIPRKAREAGVTSGLSVPMFRRGKIVGAFVVQTLRPRQFSRYDVDFISLIANNTATSAEKVEHREAATRKTAEIEALYAASKTIADASRGLKRSQILDPIVEQAVRSVVRANGFPKPVFGTLQLYDRKTNELVFESVYPRQQLPKLVERLGERRALYRGHKPGWKIGVTGRTVITKLPMVVDDVSKDDDYLQFNSATKSEMTVPLFDRGADPLWDQYPVLGVLNVESDQISAFDEDDAEALSAVAELAGIAIENAKRHDELKKIKGLVGARSALAWMGMTSNHWRHAVQGHAITIKDHIKGIQKELPKKIDSTTKAAIGSRLREISELAELVEQHPITAPLSSEEGVGSLLVNALLRERMGQLKGDARYKHVEVKFDLALTEDATVRVSRDWLRRALDVLVDNAVEAMADSARKILTVGSIGAGKLVEIRIHDTGSGVPDSIKAVLFKERIEKPKGSKGLGMGLLMSQCIVETYGGEVRLVETGPSGTAMVISLPREV